MAFCKGFSQVGNFVGCQVQLEKLTAELKSAVNIREHFGDSWFGSSPLTTLEFPTSMGMSLPARLTTSLSTPVAIMRSPALEPQPFDGNDTFRKELALHRIECVAGCFFLFCSHFGGSC